MNAWMNMSPAVHTKIKILLALGCPWMIIETCIWEVLMQCIAGIFEEEPADNVSLAAQWCSIERSILIQCILIQCTRF